MGREGRKIFFPDDNFEFYSSVTDTFLFCKVNGSNYCTLFVNCRTSN